MENPKILYLALLVVSLLAGYSVTSNGAGSMLDNFDGIERGYGLGLPKDVNPDSLYQSESPHLQGLKQNDRPSVIMISIETLRADHLPCYGYYRDTMPFLCNFAEENILFEDPMAQATWTIPSETSVFTSQYPMVHEVFNRTDSIPESKKLLAEQVPSEYSKAGFTGGMDVAAKYGFSQGFDKYKSADSGVATGAGFNQSIPKAVNWLEDNHEDRFFMFLQGYDPHSPYRAPEPYRNMYVDNYTGMLENYTIGAHLGREDWILDQLKKYPDKGYRLAMNDTEIPITEEDINYTIARYDGELRYTDYQLKRLVTRLKEMGAYKDTAIVIYSNHGEALDDHVAPGFYMNGHRRSPFREQIHVPLIMRIPGVEKRTVDGPVALIDIYPTILDMLGETPPKQIQGESLLKEIERGVSRGHVFSEGAGIQARTVISDDWKYMFIPDYYGVGELGGGDTHILYNRSVDEERENLYTEFEGVSKRMQRYMDSWKLENLRLQDDTEKDIATTKNTAEDVVVSPSPPKWWSRADEPPHIITLKSNFCQFAQISMQEDVSPEFRVCTNDGGFRGRNYSLQKPENVHRTVALGDAVTFGVGVDNNETYPAYLQRRLNDDASPEDPDFQVLNFGLPFKTTKEEVQWFKRKGVRYNPDLVVLQYMENDAENLTRIDELKRNIKADLSDDLSSEEKERKAIRKAILQERYERQNMSIDEEMETVDPYLNELENLSEKHDFEVLVMYYATRFSRRHVPYMRQAAEERNWSFMISDIEESGKNYTFGNTFNLRPSGNNRTAGQVKKKMQELGVYEGVEA